MMPLNPIQVNTLRSAINAYGFPPTHYDFNAMTPVYSTNMTGVEKAIQTMLLSSSPAVVKQGLANVLYWGYAQIGFGPNRLHRFWNIVTATQIAQFQALILTHSVPSLRQLRAIGMPEFSGISFLSKVLMFLDPVNYCVLDLQLAGIRITPPTRSLHRLVVHGTTIGATFHNQNIYNAWCADCANINHLYYGGAYRVADIERGFFQLIQTGNLQTAQTIYAAV
ncbi:TPA: hypothetical protein ACNIJL_002321 [Pseudomonas aeruginosa]